MILPVGRRQKGKEGSQVGLEKAHEAF